MANYTTTASVSLNVNGRQAGMVLDQMRQKADQLQKALDKEKLSPNPDLKKLEQLRKQLQDCRRVIDQMQPSAQSVEQVLNRLDRASPRELQKTLKKLTSELNNIERGSKAWDAQMEKIRRVKKEMQDLQEAMNPKKTLMDKVKEFFSDWGNVAAAAAAAAAGVIAAGKAAVKAYADMEQEMANVRKFTGMTSDEVEQLNEKFKAMDTRTSREELNKLAQEAGRLGKQSVEEVSGFVRAADKINVSLDDLGSDAVLKLSKLTGIFGDEERLGTEKALLSVGSVINELSQNCAASAPYIAEFASRMGGVGAQAGLTVQQIMAMASVLDSNSQALEASATAVSQVMVRLYQQPAKYAKVAGMDAKAFTKLVKEDMNAAFIQFLETLNKAGGMDTLSPMFKDMGENGSRAIAALSTLATNIDAVKSQQQVANEAFREATSIGKEFEVQNNTVQAGLDKAKKGFTEMAVELGQKLQPVMKYAISSSSILMRTMITIIDFISSHIKTIGALSAAVAVYALAVNAATIKTKALEMWTATLAIRQKALHLANLLAAGSTALLSGNITRARIAFQLFSKALMANPIGLVMTAVTALIALLVSLREKTDEYSKAVSEAMDTVAEFEGKSVEEMRTLDSLFAVLRVGNKDTERYKKAKDQVISQYGKYLKGLIDENGEISNLTLAYDRLTAAIQRANREKGIAAARAKADEAFFGSSGDLVQKIEKAMLRKGASKEEAVRVSDALAKMIASGQRHMDPEAEILVKKYYKKTNVLDENLEEYGFWGSAWQSVASNRYGEYQKSNPLHFYKLAQDMVDKNAAANKNFDQMSRSLNPFPEVSTDDLEKLAEGLRIATADNTKEHKVIVPASLAKGGRKMQGPMRPGFDTEVSMNSYQAAEALEKVMAEIAYRGGSLDSDSDSDDSGDGGKGYTSAGKKKKSSGGDKVMQQVKKELKDIKAEYEKAQAKIIGLRSRGEISYDDMLDRQRKAEVKFYDDSLKVFRKHNRTESEEYASMVLKKSEADANFRKEEIVRSREVEERIYKIQEQEIRSDYADRKESFEDQMAMQEELFVLKVHHLDKLASLYDKSSKEYMDLMRQREDAVRADMLSKEEAFQKKVLEIKKKYAKLDPAAKVVQAKAEMDLVRYLREQDAISDEDADFALARIKEETRKVVISEDETAKALREYADRKRELEEALKEGIISQEEFNKESAKNGSSKRHKLFEKFDGGGEWAKSTKDVYVAWADMMDAITSKADDIPEKVGAAVQAASALICAGMQTASDFTQAQMAIQEARIKKRYDKEIEFAEGNSFLVRRLERKRDKELKKLKEEESRKQFAMQVIQTVAQTAVNAVMAYKAGLSIGGPAGLVLAKIAAAMAVAQGMAQVALIKKQQQAAAATGYSEGGFTKPGRKDEPAGIVHAGEWVASQKLVKNPRTRPMIEALEYMQRHNTIGRLDRDDVSRYVSASVAPSVVVMKTETPQAPATDQRLSETIDALTDRLNRPFITVNSITGPEGFNQAKERYDRLIKNASR